MAALNHAILIPGLILVFILLWAWFPILVFMWCVRRTTGWQDTDDLLESGHIPHAGFEPPPPYEAAAALKPIRQHLAPPLHRPRRQFHNRKHKDAHEAQAGGKKTPDHGEKEMQRRDRRMKKFKRRVKIGNDSQGERDDLPTLPRESRVHETSGVATSDG